MTAAGTPEEELTHEVRIAIEATLPDSSHPKHWNHALFGLCRRLKTLDDFCGSGANELRKPVEEWWRRASFGHHDFPSFAEVWAEFQSAWTKVRTPHGEGPMSKAANEALECARKLTLVGTEYEDIRLRHLVCLCMVLSEQHAVNEATFRLDCRSAGDAIGADKNLAAAWLRMLCKGRVIECVELGTRGRATRYRWIGLP